jgi:hypothetical protein
MDDSASIELKRGIEWSLMMTSQAALSSAVSKLCRVSTRKWSTVYPTRSRWRTIRAVSSSESSTNNSRSVPLEVSLDIGSRNRPRGARANNTANGGAKPDCL